MLIQLFIVFLCLFESASAQCMGSDKLISETCYTFVNKPMSFEDARDYCHNHNNRWSYLGIVSNRIESNFVAAYASSMFNSDYQHFWFGMSRASSSLNFVRDDGIIATFDNWDLGEPNGNYAAESITNARWKTFPSAMKLPFICSYSIYVTGQPTSKSVLLTTTTEEPCDGFSGTVSYAYEMTNDAPVSAKLMKDHLYNLDIFDYDQTIAVNVPFPDTFSYDILLYNTIRSKAELVGNLEDQVISYGLTKSPSIVESLDYILKKNVNGKHVIILIANSSTEVDANNAKADADQLRAKEDTIILTVSFDGTDLSSLATNGFNVTVDSRSIKSFNKAVTAIRHLLCHL